MRWLLKATTHCKCGTWACWLDSVQHRLHLGGFSGRVCDWHDRNIRGF